MKKIVARVLTPLALVAGLVIASAPAANAYTYVGVDMLTACKSQYGPSWKVVVLNPGDAYSWRCYTGTGAPFYGVSVKDYCKMFYGPGWNAAVLNPYDAYSWRCFA